MIPLTIPELGDEEVEATERVLRSGMLVQGPEVQAFEELLAEQTSRSHAVAVSSGTAALELALRAVGIGAGDDVLCPALTWPSPAHAIRGVGANVVLVDVDSDEWNVRAEALADARTPQTRAAIVVDQFGFQARHGEIEAALDGLSVIVDAACSVGSSYEGSPGGARGIIATTSFHPRKVLTTGEGGACLTDDPVLAGRLRALRNHGQESPGQFSCVSGNYRLTDVAGAMGRVQMGKLRDMCARRRAHGEAYRQAFAGLKLQQPAPASEPNFQTFGLLAGEPGGGSEARDRGIEQLRERGVGAGLLTYSLARLPQFSEESQQARQAGRDLATAADIASRGLALPLYPRMTDQQREQVVDAVRAVLT